LFFWEDRLKTNDLSQQKDFLMRFRSWLAASAVMLAPLGAHAQAVTGPYVDLGLGGVNTLGAGYQNNVLGGGKIVTRPDYAGSVGAGFGFGNGLRVELDGVDQRATAHEQEISSNPVPLPPPYLGATPGSLHEPLTGGANTYGFLVNGIYDLPLGLPVSPYLGAGVGYEWTQLNSDVRGSGSSVSGTAGSFAYDLVAGVAYPVAAVPGLSLTAEYRFSQLVQSRSYAVSNPTYFSGSEKLKLGQISMHEILFGVRYQLCNAPAEPAVAPATAAAPMAAPAPVAKTYLVFFDWDKALLTPRAVQIIAEAASDSKSQNVTTLDVSGYTDTSGTAVYNQGLSERRAKAVAARLVADGVSAAAIEIHAYGETHLLVPTGPGVREPQNRRVEIVLN
jgi:outer membrane protein OmpA-like peptidoglycan-associated protein